jgi:hypothetical protein
VTLLEAADDPNLFAAWFRDRKTWAPWFAFLAVLLGYRLTKYQAELYRQCTGRAALPSRAFSEAWLICGRRSGKSFALGLIAVFLAAFHDYSRHLSPGERGTVLILATDRRQARVIFRYLTALITRVPLIAAMIERETADTFDLSNGVSIEVATASYRSVRGYTVVAALADEIAFWPTDDSAEPDYAVLDALRPGMATIPGAILLCASSPYGRRGALWDAHRQHYGKDGDSILVWQAATRVMNPTVPQAVIERAVERDEASASAEYLAQFRADVERAFSREAIEAVVSAGVIERSRISGVRYFGFADPSGGSSDSFTGAVAHQENGLVILDAVRERRPPFSPEVVTKELAEFFKSYGVATIKGDRYAGEWPREAFRRHGVNYVTADKPKSEIYGALIPAVNSGKVDLVDNARLVAQLAGLERHTSRSGRDSIDHSPGSHDDVANVVAGVLIEAAGVTKIDDGSDIGPPIQVGAGLRFDRISGRYEPLPRWSA